MLDTTSQSGVLTLDGTTTTQVWDLSGGRFGTTAIVFNTSTSLVVSIAVSGIADTSSDYSDITVNTKTATSYAAGASITVSRGTILMVDTYDVNFLKVTRVSGSGTLHFVSADFPSNLGASGVAALVQAAIKNEDTASAGADPGMVIHVKRSDTPANSSGTDGDYEPLQMSAGRLWTSSTVTSVVPGTAATSLGKAEDAPHTTGDTGIMALAVRQDTLSVLAANGDYVPLVVDANGALCINLSTLIAGENQTTNRMMVEHAYSYSAPVVADTTVKSGAGFLHAVTITQQDAAPTAGTIQIRDATSAGTGTIIWEWILTTAVFTPFSLIFDVAFTTGLQIDVTTTGDVNVTCSYR